MSDIPDQNPDEIVAQPGPDASNSTSAASGSGSPVVGGQASPKTPEPAIGGVGRVMKKLNGVVEKTILDLDACRDVVSRLITENDTKSKDEANFRSAPDSSAPVKQVSKYKLAATCDSDWNSLIGTSRCRFCSTCSLNVYDCSNMDQAEVDQLVLQKENKQSFILYKRKDGRFLTADCPVGQQRIRSGLTTMASVAAAVVGLIAAGVWMMSNKPAEPADTSLGQVLQSTDFSGASNKGAGANTGNLPKLAPASPNLAVSPVMSDSASSGMELGSSADMKNALAKIKFTPTLQPLETQYGLPKEPLSVPAYVPTPLPGNAAAPGPTTQTSADSNLNSLAPAQSGSGQGASPQAQSPQTQAPQSGSSYVQYYGAEKK